MQAIIPTWAYPLPPTGWADFTYYKYDPEAKSHAPDTTQRVPLWVAATSGLYPQDFMWLVVRVLPEYELVLRSSDLCDPVSLSRCIQKRRALKKWPARNWELSHIVYLTRVTKMPSGRRRVVQRHCFGRMPDRRGTFHQLAFIPLPPLGVAIDVAGGDAASPDVCFRASEQADDMPRRFHFVAEMAAREAAERKVIFRILEHALGESFVNSFTETCRILIGRSAHLSDERQEKFCLKDHVRGMASTEAENYAYPCTDDAASDAEYHRFCSVLLALQRSPMAVLFVDTPGTVKFLEAMAAGVFLPPAHFGRKGLPADVKACYVRVAIDIRFDAEKRQPLYCLAVLPPHFDKAKDR
jgi:hypothetical protein